MITLSPFSEEGFPVIAPCCGRRLFTMLDKEDHTTDFLYSDGDIVDVFPLLRDDQRKGFGRSTHITLGECPLCDAFIIGLETSMVAAAPDVAFQDRYFFRNEKRGLPTNFVAGRGDEKWIMSCFDTPLGPMFEHIFGPLTNVTGEWVDPQGAVNWPREEGGDFACNFLLERWDELIEQMRASTAQASPG
ncbi:MAG: hypothetical protein AB7U61_09110 [Methylocystis sp.]